MKNNLNVLVKETDKTKLSDTVLDKPKPDNLGLEPKNKRPKAKVYFKEMTSSRDTLEAFIKEHLAPAVAGRTIHNVGGAYYGALAKNSCETATSIVHNTICNYKAFKKKLESYSISPEELSKLLAVEVNYKSSKKVKRTPVSKKEQALGVLRSKLSEHITDDEKLESLVQNIYTKLKPIMNKTK